MKTTQVHDYRPGHVATWEFSPEQAEQLDRGEPVAWYGPEQVFAGAHGCSVVHSAARPGNVPAAAVVRGG